MGHKKRTLTKKSAAGITAALLSLSLGVSAVAYWTATGTGSGSAATTSGSTNVLITQTSEISDLEPGSTIPDNIVGNLTTQGGNAPIFVGTVTPTVTGTSNPACGPENFLTQPAIVNVTVPSNSTIHGVSLGTVVFDDSHIINQDACKGVTVYLSYTSSAWQGVGTPSQPTNLTGVAGNAQVSLTWNAPASGGGSTITGYQVQYSSDQHTWTTATADTASTSTSYTVTGLTNGTPYWFRVAAINAATSPSTGNPATTTSALTPSTSPSAPTAITGTGGNHKVDLTWTAGDNGGSVITGYTVKYSTDNSNWTTASANTGSNLTSYSVTGLTNGTPYYFEVAAINANGTSSFGAATNNPITPYTNPDAPTGFTATPANTSVGLSWSAPTDTGGKDITGYEVQISTDQSTWTTLSSSISGTTYNATGLTNGTTYYFQVAALNNTTSISEWASASATPFTAPGAPSGVTGTPGDQQVTLNWTTPSDGGKAIMGYQVQYSTNGTSWTTAISNTNSTSPTYTVTGLTNGTQYSFRVAAINNATESGLGTLSSWSTVTTSTPYAVPDAPFDVQGAASSGNIALTWNAPTQTGGLPIAGYKIQISTDNSTWNTVVANTNAANSTPVPTNYIVTTDASGNPLSGTQGYYFRVASITGTGTSPGGATSDFSAASPQIFAQTVPGAPTNLTVLPGDTTAQLSWTAPASDGGNAIIGYEVDYSTDGSTWTTATANNALTSGGGSIPTTYTVRSLTNGTAYYFRVAAINGLGIGPAVTTATTYTPAIPTAAITSPANGGVAATWNGVISGTATANAGTTLNSVALYVQEENNDYWTGTNWVTTKTSVTPTGTSTWSYTLPSGAFDGSAHTYTFTAVATNNATASSAAAVSTYTLYPTPPGVAVTYPVASTTYGPGWNGAITGTATLYKPYSLVTLSTVNVTITDTTASLYWNGSAWTSTPATVPATITGHADQTSGGNYADTLYSWSYSMPGGNFTSQSGDTFSVTAVATDSVGNTTTSSATSFGYYYAAPTAVTGVTGTPTNGQVQLNWTSPSDNGGASITGYQVQYSTNGSTWTTASANTGSATTSYTVTGLTNGTAYYFKVAALNAVGAGTAGYVGGTSAPGSTVTPYTVPGAPSITNGTAGNGQVTLTWTAPSSTGGKDITGYQVQYSTDQATWMTAAANTGSTSTNYTATGLTNGTAYYFQVAAINHTTADLGTFSAPYGPVTPFTTPEAPTSLTGTAGSNGQVPLSWTAPVSGGASVSGYIVKYSTNGSTWTTATSNTGSTSTTYTVTGLTNGTEYYFEVAAINSAGTGPYAFVNSVSTPGSTVIPYTTPGTPTGVGGNNYQNSKVTIYWSAPLGTGGSAITGYVVQYSSDSGSTWTTASMCTGTSTGCAVTGLTNGTSYVFHVAATNAAGTGSYSTTSPAYVPATNPSAPTFAGTSGTLSGSGGQGVAFDSSGNAYVADYYNNRVVEITPSGTQTTAFSVTSPSGVAVDSSGNIYTTSGMNVDEYTTGGTLNTLWTAPTYTPVSVAVDSSGNVYAADGQGGVYKIPAGGGTATVVGTTGNANGVAVDSSGNIYVSDTLNGLRRISGGTTTTIGAIGSLYATGVAVDSSGNVYVSTQFDHAVREYVNSSGTFGSPSAVAVGVNLATSGNPIAVNPSNGDVYATSVSSALLADLTGTSSQALPVSGNGQATVSWTASASNGGAAISYYTVQVGGSTCTTSSTSCTVTGLTNGNAQTVRVSATNAAGLTSTQSYAAPVVPAGPASAPATLTATGRDSSVAVIWGTPSSRNGAYQYSYQVQYSTDGTRWTPFSPATPLDGNSLSTTVTGLTNGTSYYIRVAALSVAGTGAYEYVGSTTTSPGNSTLAGTVPTAPTTSGIYATVSGSASSMTFDSAGNAYVVSNANVVSKITPSGTVSSVGFTGLSATVNGIAVDSSGDVFVADYLNNRIEEMSASGTQSQFASFSRPVGIAIDSSNNIYISNIYNGNVCEYTSTDAAIGCRGSGLGGNPYGLAVDSSGNVYVSDTNNNRVVKITPGNVQTTIGPAFYTPAGIGVDSSGNVYVGDTTNHVVTEIHASDGSDSMVSAGFMTGGAVGVDPSDNVYVGNVGGSILDATTNATQFTGRDGSITVNWGAPTSNGGSAITGYTVTATGGTTCTTTGATSCTLTGLTPGTYGLSVTATNAFGTSSSTTLPSIASYTTPSAPPSLAAVNGSTQVTLGWSASSNTNSYVTSYKVQSSTDGSHWSTIATVSKSTTLYVVSGLTNGTTLYFRVGAVSPYGTSYVYYNSGNPGTPLTPNGAIITAPTAGATVGQMLFNTPAGTATPTSGATISSVKLTIEDTTAAGSIGNVCGTRVTPCYWNGSGWQSGATTVTATGTTSWGYSGIAYSNLANAHTYSMLATMTDSSATSLTGPATTWTYSSASNPGTVTYPVNSTIYGANLASTATGTMPSGTSPVAYSLYDVTANKYWNGSSWQTAQAWPTDGVTTLTSTTWSANLPVAALTNTHSYTYSFLDLNALGNFGVSTASAFSYSTTAPTASVTSPSGATTTTAFASAMPGGSFGFGTWAFFGPMSVGTLLSVASGSLSIHDTTTGNYWNGTAWQSSPATVTANTTMSGNTWAYGQNMTASSFITSGANYGDTITVTPTIVDSAGNTGTGTTGSFTLGVPPGTPPSLTATVTGSNTMLLTAGTATDGTGGSGSTKYVFAWSTDGSTWYTFGGSGTTSPTYSIQSGTLTSGTAYHFEVYATNSYGNSSLEYLGGSLSNTATPINAAPAVTTATATAGNGQATVNWTPPTGTAAAPVTGYTIGVYSGASLLQTLTDNNGSDSSYTVTGLTNGTAYTFRVAAQNAAGSSGYATTTATTPYTTPSALDGTSISATSSTSGSENLTWTAPNNGGSAITGYTVQYSTNGTSWTTATSNTGSGTASYTVTGLTASTAYYFRVAAINAAGTGAYGATTSTFYPAAPTVAVTSPSAAVGPTWNGVVSGTTTVSASGSAISSVNVAVSQAGTPIESGAATLGSGTWTYSLTGTEASNSGSYTVKATVTDSLGNTGTTTYTLVVNDNNVTAAIGTPAASTTYTHSSSSSGTIWSSTSPQASSIQGTATVNQTNDSANSLASASVAIKNGSGQWWNGSSFQTGYTTVAATVGTGSSGVYPWYYTISDSNLSSGAYTVYLTSAIDARGNNLNAVGVNGPSQTLTYLYATPGAPSTVSATTTGTSGQLGVTWTASSDGGGTISGYQLQVSTDGTTYYIANNNTGSTAVTANISSYCTTWSGGTPGSGTCTASQPLSNGTGYYVKVAGINQLGMGSFTTSSSTTAPAYQISGANYLIVAGGGGAGSTVTNYKGGGGGAGGGLTGTWSPVANTSYSVTVGGGGAGGAAGSNHGTSGSNSSLTNVATATGGGYGGGGDSTNSPSIQSGANGGSGGGAGHGPTTGVTAGSASPVGQGWGGGISSASGTYFTGGGGGGWYGAGGCGGGSSCTGGGGAGITWAVASGTTSTFCTTGAVATAGGCYGYGGTGNSGTAIPTTAGSGGSAPAAAGAGYAGSAGVVGFSIPTASLGSAGSVAFTGSCTTANIVQGSNTVYFMYGSGSTGCSGTMKYTPTAGSTTISAPGAGALGTISSFAGAVSGSMTTSNGSTVPSTTNAVTITIKDTTSNTYWTGSGWSSTNTTVTTPATTPGGSTSTWTYSIAAANFTSGHSYSIQATSVDSGGTTSTSTATTFTASGF